MDVGASSSANPNEQDAPESRKRKIKPELEKEIHRLMLSNKKKIEKLGSKFHTIIHISPWGSKEKDKFVLTSTNPFFEVRPTPMSGIVLIQRLKEAVEESQCYKNILGEKLCDAIDCVLGNPHLFKAKEYQDSEYFGLLDLSEDDQIEEKRIRAVEEEHHGNDVEVRERIKLRIPRPTPSSSSQANVSETSSSRRRVTFKPVKTPEPETSDDQDAAEMSIARSMLVLSEAQPSTSGLPSAESSPARKSVAKSGRRGIPLELKLQEPVIVVSRAGLTASTPEPIGEELASEASNGEMSSSGPPITVVKSIETPNNRNGLPWRSNVSLSRLFKETPKSLKSNGHGHSNKKNKPQFQRFSTQGRPPQLPVSEPYQSWHKTRNGKSSSSESENSDNDLHSKNRAQIVEKVIKTRSGTRKITKKIIDSSDDDDGNQIAPITPRAVKFGKSIMNGEQQEVSAEVQKVQENGAESGKSSTSSSANIDKKKSIDGIGNKLWQLVERKEGASSSSSMEPSGASSQDQNVSKTSQISEVNEEVEKLENMVVAREEEVVANQLEDHLEKGSNGVAEHAELEEIQEPEELVPQENGEIGDEEEVVQQPDPENESPQATYLQDLMAPFDVVPDTDYLGMTQMKEIYRFNAHLAALEATETVHPTVTELFRTLPITYSPFPAKNITRETLKEDDEYIYQDMYDDFFNKKITFEEFDQFKEYITRRRDILKMGKLRTDGSHPILNEKPGQETGTGLFLYKNMDILNVFPLDDNEKDVLKHQNYKGLRIGDIVWAKFQQNWWPGYIIGFTLHDSSAEHPPKRELVESVKLSKAMLIELGAKNQSPKDVFKSKQLVPPSEVLVHVRYSDNDRSYQRLEEVEPFIPNFRSRFTQSVESNYQSQVATAIDRYRKKGYFEEYMTKTIRTILEKKGWTFDYLPPFELARVGNDYKTVNKLPNPLALTEVRLKKYMLAHPEEFGVEVTSARCEKADVLLSTVKSKRSMKDIEADAANTFSNNVELNSFLHHMNTTGQQLEDFVFLNAHYPTSHLVKLQRENDHETTFALYENQHEPRAKGSCCRIGEKVASYPHLRHNNPNYLDLVDGVDADGTKLYMSHALNPSPKGYPAFIQEFVAKGPPVPPQVMRDAMLFDLEMKAAAFIHQERDLKRLEFEERREREEIEAADAAQAAKKPRASVMERVRARKHRA